MSHAQITHGELMEMMVPMGLCIALRDHFDAPHVSQSSKPLASRQHTNKTLSGNAIRHSIHENRGKRKATYTKHDKILHQSQE